MGGGGDGSGDGLGELGGGGDEGGGEGGGNGGGEGGSLHSGNMLLSPAIRKLRPEKLQQPTANRISTCDVCSNSTSTDLLLWWSVSATGDVGLSSNTPYCVLQKAVNVLSTGSATLLLI